MIWKPHNRLWRKSGVIMFKANFNDLLILVLWSPERMYSLVSEDAFHFHVGGNVIIAPKEVSRRREDQNVKISAT